VSSSDRRRPAAPMCTPAYGATTPSLNQYSCNPRTARDIGICPAIAQSWPRSPSLSDAAERRRKVSAFTLQVFESFNHTYVPGA